MSAKNASVKIGADYGDFMNAIQQIQTAMQGFSKTAESVGKSMRSFDKVTDEVTDGLRKQKQETDRLKQSSGSLGKTTEGITKHLQGQIGTLGALGAGYLTLNGAVEGFKKMMMSTQATGDAFQRTMAGLQGAIDHVFNSLARGDFSGLISGMEQATQAAKDLYDAMDKLGDTDRAVSLADAMAERVQSEAKKIAATIDPKDKSPEAEAKRKLVKEMNEQATQIRRTSTERHIDATRATVDATIAGLIKTPELQKYAKQVDPTALVINTLSGNDAEVEERKKWVEKSKERKTEKTGVDWETNAPSYSESPTDEAKAYQRRIEEDKKKNPLAWVKLEIEDNLSEDGRKKLTDLLIKEQQGIKKRTDQDTESLGTNRTVDGQATASKPTAKAEKKPEAGSIGYLEAELSKIRKAFNEATTRDLRIALEKQAQELEKRIKAIKEDVEMATAALKPIKAPLSDLKKHAGYNDVVGGMQGKGGADLSGDFMKTSGMQAYAREQAEAMKDVQAAAKGFMSSYTRELEKAREQNAEFVSSLDMVSNSFSVLGNAIGGNAGEFLNWAGNVASAIGQAIPMITALTSAQTAQSAIASKAAVTGAAAASSVLGPIGVIAAIASVVGALASIPKFATGGIVGGNSPYGDKILARVNSGEMIANAQQQRKIWEAMNQGQADRLQQALQVNVHIKETVRGRDLKRVVSRSEHNETRF